MHGNTTFHFLKYTVRLYTNVTHDCIMTPKPRTKMHFLATKNGLRSTYTATKVIKLLST